MLISEVSTSFFWVSSRNPVAAALLLFWSSCILWNSSTFTFCGQLRLSLTFRHQSVIQTKSESTWTILCVDPTTPMSSNALFHLSSGISPSCRPPAQTAIDVLRLATRCSQPGLALASYSTITCATKPSPSGFPKCTSDESQTYTIRSRSRPA